MVGLSRASHASQRGVLPAEVLSAIRGLVLSGHLDEFRANRARRCLALSRLLLHDFAPYADRIWELRHNLTVYDAWYVAVAERLETPLVTTDERLARSNGVRCEVLVVKANG
jgi:predicted nucleic acid-binding protein